MKQPTWRVMAVPPYGPKSQVGKGGLTAGEAIDLADLCRGDYPNSNVAYVPELEK